MTETDATQTEDVPTEAGKKTRRTWKESHVPTQLRRLSIIVIAVALPFLGNPSPEELSIGLLLAVVGESIRCWSAGYLVKTHELITGGPYAHVRNPLYLGRFFLLAGVMVASRMPYHVNLVLLAVGMGVFFGYYIPRKERVEPRRLRNVHGAPYERYEAAVPSLFPQLKAYDQPQGSWRWANFIRNQEPNVVVAIVLFFAVLAFRTELV